MLIDPRFIINVYRLLLFIASVLSGGICNWIFIILRAAKDPWWGIGYAVASVILASLPSLVFALPILSVVNHMLSSDILEVLPDVVEMVDPASDALLALFGLVIGGIGAVVVAFVSRPPSCCS